MKRIAFSLMLSLILTVPGPAGTAQAKPLYCGDALRNCLEACDHSNALIRYGCSAGCGIGYLACGN